SFTLKTYAITATAGAGGSISASATADCGADQSFTITPDACHVIADVVVDNVSVGPVASYPFTNVTASHTIAASFTLKTYAITATAGAGGSISASATVDCGADQSFTITPDACHVIADVVVDNFSVGPVASYPSTLFPSTPLFRSSFTLKTYAITATAGA